MHPELTESEIFVGNTKLADWPAPELASLKTARLGNTAYTIDGDPIPSDDMRPLFIGKSEANRYDTIRMAQFRAIRGWQ